MFVLVCYDISEDKRRTKIHKILKSYGEWKQYSVFHCDVTDTQYARMRQRLSRKRIVYFFTFCVLAVRGR
jgi:CRISPR-associated protein Cas2